MNQYHWWSKDAHYRHHLHWVCHCRYLQILTQHQERELILIQKLRQVGDDDDPCSMISTFLLRCSSGWTYGHWMFTSPTSDWSVGKKGPLHLYFSCPFCKPKQNIFFEKKFSIFPQKWFSNAPIRRKKIRSQYLMYSLLLYFLIWSVRKIFLVTYECHLSNLLMSNL